MRINDMVQMNYQKQNIAKQSKAIPSGKDWINPHEDPNRNITGSTAHRKIVPVSDEIKGKLTELTKKTFLEDNGMSDGEAENKIINDYLETLPSKERSAAAWTLNQFGIETAKQFREKIQETETTWNYGQSFDKSVLDNFPSKHIDIKV